MIAINEALESGDAAATMQALRNPNACLNTVEDGNEKEYQERLLAAKKQKAEAAKNRVRFMLTDQFFLCLQVHTLFRVRVHIVFL